MKILYSWYIKSERETREFFKSTCDARKIILEFSLAVFGIPLRRERAAEKYARGGSIKTAVAARDMSTMALISPIHPIILDQTTSFLRGVAWKKKPRLRDGMAPTRAHACRSGMHRGASERASNRRSLATTMSFFCPRRRGK